MFRLISWYLILLCLNSRNLLVISKQDFFKRKQISETFLFSLIGIGLALVGKLKSE